MLGGECFFLTIRNVLGSIAVTQDYHPRELAPRCGDTSGTYAVGKGMLHINDKFVEPNAAWESVDARMKAAYALVQAVLMATGYDKASGDRCGDTELDPDQEPRDQSRL
jgi:hypothetical protein